MSFDNGIFNNLTIEEDYTSKRISSWDRTGGNTDFIYIGPNEKKTIAEIDGPGCIRHIYSTSLSVDPFFYRNLILRVYWDGEDSPSIEVPWGDFFGIGHCRPKLFSSLMLSVNPGNLVTFDRDKCYTYGINCYFPMPFSKSAVLEIENQSDIPVENFWYHIDYHSYDSLDSKVMRFHAAFNREKITKVSEDVAEYKNIALWDKENIGGRDNYIILNTEGNGKLVGIILNVDNIAGGWWGEGDDMVFIDNEKWPPSLHGTGTEEIFGAGACPAKEYFTPYCGFHQISNSDYYRHNSMFRLFILDPIRFKKSIKYTIEHGHANNFENDYSSVAYWYQREPHVRLKTLKAGDRRPLLHSPEEKEFIERQNGIIKKIYMKSGSFFQDLSKDKADKVLEMLGEAERMYFKTKYDLAMDKWKSIDNLLTG